MQVEGILDIVRRATLFDIFIISFFVLPIAASQWIKVLEALAWDLHWGLGAMLAFYVLAVAIMMWGAERRKRHERARDLILGYLYSKDFEMMSFARVQQRIDPAYTDAFLDGLVTRYPQVFRRATLKGQKPGLARLDDADEPEDQEA